MRPGHPEESWESWTARIADDLAAMSDGAWVSFVVHVDSAAVVAERAAVWRRGWRRALIPPPPPPTVPEVFLQASRVADVLALECIGDTEFEGLTDLTRNQQRALVAAGWEQDGTDPTFNKTFSPSESFSAAVLLEASLRDVLGATSPSAVDLRRPPT